MGIMEIPFNDEKGLAEIEKIVNDPVLGKNLRKARSFPLPQDRKGLRQVSEIIDGLSIEDLIKGLLGTETEVIFRTKRGRELTRTQNTTTLGGRTSILENSFGLDPNIDQHITVNSILGIPHSQTNNVILNGIKRKTDYFMAGDGASSIAVPGKVFKAKNYETNLYRPLPFRLVPFSSDLSTSERQEYRLRKVVEINGNDYVGYWAKKFEPGSLYLQYNDANYVPQESDTVPVDENNSSHPLMGGSVLCFVQFTLIVEENELKEYFQVTNGSIELASMSEVGIVYGADLPNSLDGDKNELAAAELFSKATSKPYYLDSEGTAREIVYKVYVE
jgi:hypothetical protein